MYRKPVDLNEFKARLLVWAARIVRTAAEIEDDPDKSIRFGDTARRLEQCARSELGREVDVDIYDVERRSDG